MERHGERQIAAGRMLPVERPLIVAVGGVVAFGEAGVEAEGHLEAMAAAETLPILQTSQTLRLPLRTH
jgi:hypothetical protein